jgi:hypothetical protein
MPPVVACASLDVHHQPSGMLCNWRSCAWCRAGGIRPALRCSPRYRPKRWPSRRDRTRARSGRARLRAARCRVKPEPKALPEPPAPLSQQISRQLRLHELDGDGAVGAFANFRVRAGTTIAGKATADSSKPDRGLRSRNGRTKAPGCAFSGPRLIAGRLDRLAFLAVTPRNYIQLAQLLESRRARRAPTHVNGLMEELAEILFRR